PCGKGPDVALDGELYQTSVKGTVRDLVERRGVEVTLCQEGRGDSEVRLPAGEHGWRAVTRARSRSRT
ncbi:hypothetical protein, partial [Streptomyces violaceus]|uniref:hypothetical protein n=1 Tax=Streptomyces violaceus TaxID=1936 RepID=UPI003CD09222